MAKQQDINVKIFMQTREYDRLNEELQTQINHNSQMFNIKFPSRYTNLIEPTGHLKVKLTKTERGEIKKHKYTFKLHPDKGREDLVKILVNAPLPDWNIKFVERRKVV